jgi:hypothetical protein
MDLVLKILDDNGLDNVYTQTTGWARDDWKRQILGTYVVLVLGGWILYFLTAGLSWLFLFDKKYVTCYFDS